jgi:hypothetical protein
MMQYYMIEWEHEEPDDPWRLFLELDHQGRINRKIEVFRIGVYEAYENLESPPVDPREIAGAEGRVNDINYYQFEDTWSQAREVCDSFMSIFF